MVAVLLKRKLNRPSERSLGPDLKYCLQLQRKQAHVPGPAGGGRTRPGQRAPQLLPAGVRVEAKAGHWWRAQGVLEAASSSGEATQTKGCQASGSLWATPSTRCDLVPIRCQAPSVGPGITPKPILEPTRKGALRALHSRHQSHPSVAPLFSLKALGLPRIISLGFFISAYSPSSCPTRSPTGSPTRLPESPATCPSAGPWDCSEHVGH